jgi:uncharacterized protein (DUF488 family)
MIGDRGENMQPLRTWTPAVTGRYLHTFGYEGLNIEVFIARLVEAGIQSIVDVRELPLSRKKGFSKSALRERLGEAGIAYFHAPALGCPKEIRDAYRVDGDWKRYTRRFLSYLKSQSSTVDELAKIARSTSACLVCFEADHAFCHRTYVARAARDAGGPAIKHLTLKTALLDRSLQLVA